MNFFEKNTGKKIKNISVIFFICMLICCLIYLYQGVYAIAEVGHLIQQGFSGTSIGIYVQSLLLGIIPRIAFMLLAFPLYGFGKIVEASERITGEEVKNHLTETADNKVNEEE